MSEHPDVSEHPQMQAVEITASGAPDVMQIRQMPKPWPQPHEVRLKVMAAGINRPDILQRRGLYPVPKNASPILGLEVAGIVEAVGNQVSNWNIGDEVVALTNGGGYAQFVCVPFGQVLPIPTGCSFEEGAALPETLFTVQQTVMDRANLKADQTILIHGGSSGIGGAALQLATHAGAIAFCTVSSEQKARYAKSLGAQSCFNYLTEDFEARVKEVTEGRGVDVILDMVGGDVTNRNLRCLARNGTLIQIAMMAGTQADIDLSQILMKNLTWFGSTLRPQTNTRKAEIATQLRKSVWPLIETGQYRMPRLRIFAFDDVVRAHQAMESPDHFGKLVLQIGNKNTP